MEKLASSRVAIFGLGGVGGYVCEALARSGIGAFDLIDSDKIDISNINRQIIATLSTVGRYKTEVMRERILDINPDAQVLIHKKFFLPENSAKFPFSEYDYVVDAVDTVTAKIELAIKCMEAHVPVISSMGTGNKLDPTRFKVADIYETSVCPLARVMRRELKSRRVEHLKVVYSDETPLSSGSVSLNYQVGETCESNKSEFISFDGHKNNVPGSVSFVPSVAGLIIAGEVIKDLIQTSEA